MWEPLTNAYNTVAGWFRRGIGSMTDAVAHNKPAWPPEAERERLHRYERNTRLYLGEHKEVFATSAYGFHYTYDAARDYVTANLTGALTDTLIWRLFGEGLEVQGPEEDEATQAFLDSVYEDSSLDTQLLTAGAAASYLGDAWLKVRYDAEERRVLVEPVSAALVYPEFAPLNAGRMVAAVIAQVLLGRSGGKRVDYLWQERHELREGRAWITNRLYRLHGDEKSGYRFDPNEDAVDLATLEATAELPEEQDTGVDGLLLLHVPNRGSVRSPFWGTSDYEGLLELQGELNHRRTQRGEVLDKFVDPFMWGPTLDDESIAHLREHKYFETEPGAASPVGMLVWDAQLAAVVEELRDLTEQFATAAGIEAEALLPPEGGAPQSGRAIRLSQYKTGARVLAKQRYWGPALKQALALATQLANAPGVVVETRPQVVSPKAIILRWNDGLPSDDREETETLALQVEVGLNSRLAALKTLHQLTEADAQARLAQIREEENLAAPPAPEGLGLLENVQPLAPGGE